MGAELGQWNEWDHDTGLAWYLLAYPLHAGVRKYLQDLNRFYRNEPALYERDSDPEGFSWVDCSDVKKSIISYLRSGDPAAGTILVVCNATPVPRYGYRVGVPEGGVWHEALNSDADVYGGSGVGNLGGVAADPVPLHGQPHSLALTLPPLATLIFKHE